MINRKSIFGAALMGAFTLSALFAGCTKKETKETEQTEAETAEIVAEQMEAEREGREAAKYIVNNNWPDSMQLQSAILNARALNSKYEMEGKKKCKEHFDSAFFSTIRTVRPDLADQLRP